MVCHIAAKYNIDDHSFNVLVKRCESTEASLCGNELCLCLDRVFHECQLVRSIERKREGNARSCQVKVPVQEDCIAHHSRHCS